MDLSIIIPCHNSEHCIKPLLDSLVSQVFSAEVELIFVLDDCTDNTEGYLNEYWSNVPNRFTEIKLAKCKVNRCGLARNKGLEESSGKYIWFIDSDDWLLDEWAITKVTTILDIVPDIKLCHIDYKSALFPRDCPIMVWQYIFRRDAIGEFRFSGIQPHEDQEFMLNFKDCEQINIKGADMYYYNYLRPESNIWRYSRNELESDEMPEDIKKLNGIEDED